MNDNLKYPVFWYTCILFKFKKVCIMHLISNRCLALNAFKLCIYVQKYENQIVHGAVFILEEKCVPLKKWFITKSTFYVIVQWVEIFSEGTFYMKLCKKGRNILWNRIWHKKEICLQNLFQHIASCNTCTEQPLFIPCYLSSKYKYLYKKLVIRWYVIHI